MKYREGESFDDWANRVSMFEKGHALQRIANGEPIELVLEDMSRRITSKLLHPIHKTIAESVPKTTPEQLAESKQRYEEMMKSVGQAADHVDGHLFDKPE
jgi:glutamyl-tRNA reductase